MQPHTRALIAAAAHAVISGRKVAGIYDYTASEHLRIAAQCRDNRVQCADGERSVMFGGTLPELYDEGDKTFVSLAVDGAKAHGYDRASESHYVAEVTDLRIQLYDHKQESWFAYEVQIAPDS